MNEVEVTVQAASEFLGVTERSVINYIRAREIEAIKVGKTWFISKPSLDGFSQRYGIRAGPTRHTGKDEQGEIEAPETANEYGEKLDGAVTSHSVSNLRLFVIATGILRDLTTQNLEGEGSFKEKIEQLRLEALENLGAGYYSYDPINKQHGGQSTAPCRTHSIVTSDLSRPPSASKKSTVHEAVLGA